MKTYVYSWQHFEKSNDRHSELEELVILNKLGAKGWEVVSRKSNCNRQPVNWYDHEETYKLSYLLKREEQNEE